jgi:hypothetical protein
MRTLLRIELEFAAFHRQAYFFLEKNPDQINLPGCLLAQKISIGGLSKFNGFRLSGCINYFVRVAMD